MIKKLYYNLMESLFHRSGWDKINELLANIASMQKSLRMYKEFWDNTTDAMILCRVIDGQILDANPSACSLYGYPHDSFVLRTIYDVSDDPESTRNVANNKYLYVPFRYHINSDRKRFPLSCRLTYFNDNGEDIAALIIHPIKLPEGINADRRADSDPCIKSKEIKNTT
jgi:PAS domain S-box-containing protein